MKKNLLLLLFMACVAISGCKKDDPEEEASIVGKWFVKKAVYIDYENNVKVDEETETDFGNQDFAEFKADGTGTLSEVGDTDPFTYTRKDDVVTITDNPGESFDLKIKTLTATELVLVEESTETHQGKTYRSVNEVTYKK